MKNNPYAEIITSVAPRVSKYVSTFPHIQLPAFSDEFDPEKRAQNFFNNKEYYIRQNFSVNRKNEAWIREKAKEAWKYYEAGDKKTSDKIIRELLPYHEDLDGSNPIYLWEHMSYQMPGDLGINPHCRETVRKILLRYCSLEKVLEAFAGFNSYIESTLFNSVVALDYCRQALERYPYPHRERILFDLDKLNGKNKISIFKDLEFDAIVVCCGYKYPAKITPILREFYRLLKVGGRLIFIEDTTAGYNEATKRSFDPKTCSSMLKRCGFGSVRHELILPENYTRGNGELYFVNAEKKN